MDGELEQIKLKNSIGGKNKRNQHTSRLDVISFTKKRENEEFEGCGLDMPDWFDESNFNKFKSWDGEVRYIQNIKVRKYNRAQLLNINKTSVSKDAETPDTPIDQMEI